MWPLLTGYKVFKWCKWRQFLESQVGLINLFKAIFYDSTNTNNKGEQGRVITNRDPVYACDFHWYLEGAQEYSPMVLSWKTKSWKISGPQTHVYKTYVIDWSRPETIPLNIFFLLWFLFCFYCEEGDIRWFTNTPKFAYKYILMHYHKYILDLFSSKFYLEDTLINVNGTKSLKG